MNNRLIVIVIVANMALQPTISFSAEQPQGQIGYWQRFSGWMRGKATNVYEGSPNAEKVAIATAGIHMLSMPTERSNILLQPLGGYMAFQGVKLAWEGIKTGSIVSSVASGTLLFAGLNMAGLPIVNELASFSNNSAEIQKTAFLTFSAIGIGAMSAGLISAVYHNVIAPIMSGEVERDQTVDNALNDMTYEMVKAVISDSQAYPTRSTKIHALLKKNEFLSGDDSDVVVEQACNRLIAELEAKYKKGSEEEEIDQFLGEFRGKLLGKSDQEQVEYLIGQIGTVSPRDRAFVSLLRRLQNKLVVDLKRQAQTVK